MASVAACMVSQIVLGKRCLAAGLPCQPLAMGRQNRTQQTRQQNPASSSQTVILPNIEPLKGIAKDKLSNRRLAVIGVVRPKMPLRRPGSRQVSWIGIGRRKMDAIKRVKDIYVEL